MIEKTYPLLASMAMRLRHDFGLLSKEHQASEIEFIDRVYGLYAKGCRDSEVAEQTGLDLVTISQLREEVEGKGFYRA